MIKKTRVSQSPRTLSLVVEAAVLAVAFAIQPAAAQRLGGGMPSAIDGGRGAMDMPGLRLHAVNPSMSLSAPAASPLQEQMRNDYATTLMNAQRQLLQQNPSGDGRAELSVGSQLNGYTGPR